MTNSPPTPKNGPGYIGGKQHLRAPNRVSTPRKLLISEIKKKLNKLPANLLRPYNI